MRSAGMKAASLPGMFVIDFLRRGFASRLGKNVFALYAVEFAGYLLPFITIPYLVRVLQPELFGRVAFGLSFINCFVLFVNYGFDFSASRKIAINRNDRAAVNKIASEVWFAKGLLCVFGLLVLLSLAEFVTKLHSVLVLLLVLYGMVVGAVLSPLWLFIGLERMTAFSVINVAVRFVISLGLLVLVRRPSQFMFYAGLIALNGLAVGFLGLWVARRKLGVSLTVPSWRGVWKILDDGWMLFLSIAALTLFTTANAFVLGLLSDHATVGFYAPAERVMTFAAGLLNPIVTCVYPRSSHLAGVSRQEALKYAWRIFLVITALGGCLTAALLLGAPFIVHLFLGDSYGRSAAVLRILAPFVVLSAVAHTFGVQIMLPFGRDRAFRNTLLLAGVTNLVVAICMIPKWAEKGSAVAMLASGLVVTIGQGAYLWRERLLPWEGWIRSRSEAVTPESAPLSVPAGPST